MKKIIAVVLLAQSTFCLGMQSRWQNSLACLFKKVDQSVQKHPYVYIAGAVGLALGTPKLISLLQTLEFSSGKKLLKRICAKERQSYHCPPHNPYESPRPENVIHHSASKKNPVLDFSKVTVRTPKEEIVVHIDNDDDFLTLQQKIQDSLGTPPDQQRIIPVPGNALIFPRYKRLELENIIELMTEYETALFNLELRLRG